MQINQKYLINLLLILVFFLTQSCTTVDSWYTKSRNYLFGEDEASQAQTLAPVKKPVTVATTQAQMPATAPTPVVQQPPPVQIPKPEPTIAIKPAHTEDIKLTGIELKKFAYELGYDPRKELNIDQKYNILNRKKLRQLERSLDTQKERFQYSKVLPWLKNDEEKIELLSIPSIEGRQVWINKNKIWSRTKNLKQFDEMVEAQDIAIGMPSDYVRRSWGDPTNIETSGNPIYKNERWEYMKQVATPQGYKQEVRSVYFEGGKVTGWETE